MLQFSIIVPVYNLEDCLVNCLESIINQSYSEFEVLIVDDGSKDDSYQIACSYAANDSRFRVITKENGGVATARNLGLQYATGDYVWFVDGDDYIHPDSLALIKNAFERYPASDYFSFNFNLVSDKYKRDIIWKPLNTTDIRDFDCSFKEGFIEAFAHSPREACLTCYRRDLLSSESFDSYLLGEDTLFSKRMVFKARRVLFSSFAPYYYYYRETSASHVARLSHVFDYFKVCHSLNHFKGLKNGWADQALSSFCFEVGLVDGMSRVQNLQAQSDRLSAYQAWLSNLLDYIDVFGPLSICKWRLFLIGKTQSYKLSIALYYYRYLPRRYIANSPRLLHLLRFVGLLEAA